MTLHSSVTMLNRDNNMFNLRTRDCLSPAVGGGGVGVGRKMLGDHMVLGGNGGGFSIRRRPTDY